MSIESGDDVYKVGGTDVPVADGGTGASTASGARTNLGVPALWTRTADPITSNDSTEGYAVGDVWLGTNLYHVFVAVDVTEDSAVWQEVTSRLGTNTVDPTTTDDSDSNYKVGDYWVNTSNNKVFFAIDVTVNSAVWVEVSNVDPITESAMLSVGTPASGTQSFAVLTDNNNKLIRIDSSDNWYYLDGLSWLMDNADDTSGLVGVGHIIDATNNTVTIDLPASPDIGNQVAFFVTDATNTVTVNRNGNNINSSASNLTLAVNTLTWLVYVDPTIGWQNVQPANPMTTSQDLIVGGAGGAPGRLAVGTEGQVLTVSSGNVAWATPSGGSADAIKFAIALG
jgi:hypothetical protein